ncbi:hypothetical protein NDU88_004589 [Pleurodeles waltl]|uniref:Uncharacterized protein n=1 Tax=Pleurodeles waltl TaxID=8319 RepID=A0AAV7UFS7_PLEWA|nr:hypothetical protein NDU88_004589 [Pleurodeles waltl]
MAALVTTQTQTQTLESQVASFRKSPRREKRAQATFGGKEAARDGFLSVPWSPRRRKSFLSRLLRDIKFKLISAEGKGTTAQAINAEWKCVLQFTARTAGPVRA